MELRHHALRVLALDDPGAKAAAARELWALANAANAASAASAVIAADAAAIGPALDCDAVLLPPSTLPGRPALPRLVAATSLPRRSPFTAAGRAGLLHSVAHIEFNAINLALDAVWRFPGMPASYYLDWLRVASEEALHYTLLAEHLSGLGHAYGDFDAHDGLWAMTERTAADITARMALVPRTLEARGLDATPLMQARLVQAGDHRAAAILDIILRDEIGHVAVGNRWYRWLCARDGLDPVSHYRVLAARHGAPRPRAPFNVQARLQAGFTDDEIAALSAG